MRPFTGSPRNGQDSKAYIIRFVYDDVGENATEKNITWRGNDPLIVLTAPELRDILLAFVEGYENNG